MKNSSLITKLQMHPLCCWIIWSASIIYVESSFRRLGWPYPVAFKGLGSWGGLLFVTKLGVYRLVRTILFKFKFNFNFFVAGFEALSYALWSMYDLFSSDVIMGVQIYLLSKNDLLIMLSVICKNVASFNLLSLHLFSFDIIEAFVKITDNAFSTPYLKILDVWTPIMRS